MCTGALQSRTPRPRHGFSLIEAIVAIVVLSIAIPPMVWALRRAHAHRANSALASTARWLAAEKLEDALADRHSTTRGYAFVSGANYPPENPVAGFPGFSRTVSISETGPDLGTPGAGYKTVRASVSYTDGTGSMQTVSLQTVVTDYTP